MRKLSAFALCLPALLLAGTVTSTVTFSPAELQFTQANGYDVVDMARGMVIPDPGKPALPEVPVTLVIPADARVTSVTVTALSAQSLPGVFNVMPAQPARPISKPGSGVFVQPDAAVYSSNTSWPGRTSREFTTGSAAGFRLVAVNIMPLQYQPQSGRLTLSTRMRVLVSYDNSAAPVTLTPEQRDRAAAHLRSLVANPQDLNRFAPPVAESDLPQVNYLIVTNDAQAALLTPFADYRSAHGLRAEIRTVEWADRNYPGRDVQEKTRNMIIDFFRNRGLSYVLLAGDNAQVPCRKIRLDVFDTQGDIPTDLYYGDLDYSWDSNRNNIFGEMDDTVDLYADVYVGRASLDNPHQIENFIAKVAIYENNPATDYIKRSLLPSGWLWRSIGYHGRFVNDSIANITPSGWVDRKMENPPSSNVVADSFNHGFSLFDPAGHGNASGVYDENGTPIYLVGNASSQRNYRRYTILTSLACDPGEFDAEDCLAEVALNCDTAGCIATILNSRYGWGTPPQMGPSEKLCVRFCDYLLARSEFVIGATHNLSREEYSAASQYSSLWRWCMTEFNLFGDPALDVWTEAPTALTATCSDTVSTGSSSLTVTVRRNGTPLSGARVCAWKGNEVFVVSQTNGSGEVNLPIHPVTTGTLTVTTTAHNCLPGTRAVTVVPGAPEPYVVYESHSIDDPGQRNPNGILEPGETGVLTLVVRNTGAAGATNTRVVLRPFSPDVTVPDSTADFGTVSAGSTAQASDLQVTASPNAAPGACLQLLARVTSDQSEWDFVFGVDIGYPGRVTADIDTGLCGLSVTARGSLGFDCESGRQGRGFRFPLTDTSSVNAASFCLAGCGEYIADRFYTRSEGLDHDWQIAESVFSRVPIWNASEYMTSSFNDAGHPRSHNVTVNQRALGVKDPGQNNWVILVYDVYNWGAEPINGYAGILCDFDTKATDRFHDLAYTLPDLSTAFMRNVILPYRYVGVKLLTSTAPAHLTCLDHSLYVYPDSGMSEGMKYRAMAGQLGVPNSDRPFNWSVVVSTGPLSLPQNSRQRVAFAFIAAADSASYIAACQSCQQWYDANVGIEEGTGSAANATPRTLDIFPNPVGAGAAVLRWNVKTAGSVDLRVFDASGRVVKTLASGSFRAGSYSAAWNGTDESGRKLAGGIYFVRLSVPGQTTKVKTVLAR